MYQNSAHPANNGGNAATSMDPTQQQQQQQQNLNYNGMQQQQQPPAAPQQQQPQAQQQQQQQQQQAGNANKNLRKKPCVKITEQPASKALRFRYECEGRSAGSIPGVNSTPENKTYPTIEIVGYKGRAVVVVSCVTKDQPYRPHPHNLVGKEGCKKGVCTLEINSETMRAVFSNLGIQCVKKKDIEAALKAREEIRVDPFKTGFSHRFQPSSIDLNSVRLCFQVFMESDQKGRFTQPLPPVVSDPIYDKKAMSDLVICRLCSCTSTVLGNSQIILLCEKVAKEDIAVRFFEEKNGQVWEAFGEFQHTDVHKQTAITFKTPRYHSLDISEPAKVFIQLRRPSDGVTSEALPFEYVPLDSDPAHLRRKRQKTHGDPMHLLLQQQQKQQHQQQRQPNDHQDGRTGSKMPYWHAPNIPAIKTEPRDSSPQPFGLYRAPPELTPSPQPLSPTNNYHNHNTNTPSPYSMAAAAAAAAAAASAGGATAAGITPMISPSHHHHQQQQQHQQAPPQQHHHPHQHQQYNGADVPSPMDMQGYAFGQQHHQQQQPQQQHHQQQQQQHQHHQQHQQQQHAHLHAAHSHPPQFQGNPFGGGGAGPAGSNTGFPPQWEEKFNAAVAAAAAANAAAATAAAAGGHMSNLNSHNNNPFTMHNLLTPTTAPGGTAGGAAAPAHWNLTANPMHQQQHVQQHHQHQYQQQTSTEAPRTPADATNPNENTNANNINHNSNGNNSEQGPTLSNLLNFDSEQLVRINSEDQQMLRLNSDDLQISNLSIST